MSANSKKDLPLFKNKRERNNIIFFTSLVALPIVQFIIFYVCINFNMIIMAFQREIPKVGELGFDTIFVGFENFKRVFSFLAERKFLVKNSLLHFGAVSIPSMILALIFSFYIYKRYAMSGAFRVILFLPQIVPSVVFALLFNYIVSDVYQEIVFQLSGMKVEGLLAEGTATKMPTVLFYNLWVGFGVNILLFSGAMSGINESVVESAKLDGANIIQEYVYITIPMVFSTVKSLAIVSLTSIFTHQLSLHALFGAEAGDVATLGYSMFINQSALVSGLTLDLNFNELSALGVVLTLIVLPLTLGSKKLMDKFGPSVN